MHADDEADDRCEDHEDHQDDVKNGLNDLPDKAGAFDRESRYDGFPVIHTLTDDIGKDGYDDKCYKCQKVGIPWYIREAEAG